MNWSKSHSLQRPPVSSLGDPRPVLSKSFPVGDTPSFSSSNLVNNSLKSTMMKINKLLAAGKTPGPHGHFHQSWRKNQIFPMNETTPSVEHTKPTQGSDSSDNGVVIDGNFFQAKEEKSIEEKLFAKQHHTHNKYQSRTRKNTDSLTDGKTPVSQESSDLKRQPYSVVSNSQQSESKVNKDALLNPYLETSAVSSQYLYFNQQKVENRENVAHMTNFDSDKEQETSDESTSESASDNEQDDSGSESTTFSEQDSETETDPEGETESDSDEKSEDENVSESEKEAESGGGSESRGKVNGTQVFVKSVLQTMNKIRSPKPRFATTVSEISSSVGFNLSHTPYKIFKETMHNGKDKREESENGLKKEEARNKDPKPLMGQEQDFSQSSKRQSKSSSSAGSSHIQGITDKGNLPPIAENEEEEMTSVGSPRRSSLGSKFQQSVSGAESPEDDTKGSDSDDAVSSN